MMMTQQHPPDFADAHSRHWHDAERLFLCERWANADHLYGLSAECGLKAVLEAKKQIPKGGPVQTQFKKHIDKLWQEFKIFAEGRLAAGYLSMLPIDEPFGDWCIDQRYTNQDQFEKVQVEPHREAAQAVCAIVQHVIQDGYHDR